MSSVNNNIVQESLLLEDFLEEVIEDYFSMQRELIAYFVGEYKFLYELGIIPLRS